MSGRFVPRLLAVFALAAALEHPATAQTQALSVDALAGSDAPGSTLYKSIRHAVAIASGTPTVMSHIMVRGRRSGGNAVLHTNAIESWSTLGSIVLPANVSVEWDTAHSDVVGGMPTPVVVTGNALSAGSGIAAFALSPTAALTRSNVMIKGIQIVAFDVGVDWKPSIGTVSTLGATLDTVKFNQCVKGFHIEPATSVPVDPLVTNCSFRNTAQSATIGGDRTGGLISLTAHVELVGVGSDSFVGDYTGCLFTSDAANASGTAINIPAGFSASISSGCSATFTVEDCDFQGNGAANGTVNGMLNGLFFAGSGVLPSASFIVKNSYFTNCGYTGLTLIAAGQGSIVLNPDGSWNYTPPETNFLTPEIKSCTFNHNGYVATSTGATALDVGHGIATRTYGFGQMQPYIHLCDGTGTSAGHTNLGITANALDGVYIHSDWWLPGVDDNYVAGYITFTRNDTWLETSRIFQNLRHGVEIHLEEGSGNPGVKANRIYNDAVDGIHIDILGNPNENVDHNDIEVATPVSWNNFVYNLSGTTPVQQDGIYARFTQILYTGGNPNVIGGVGVLQNTSTNHAVNGIDVVATLATGGSINSVQNNISYFNTYLDLSLSGIYELYNCASNASGTGDITANPLLVSYTTGDLHLTSTSPCIDATPSWPPPPYLQVKDDFDLQTRPRGSAYDIGADEY